VQLRVPPGTVGARALQVLIDESWRGRRWVVETDIASCFSAIPVDAGKGVTVCDLGVFADEAAETVSPQNTHAAHLYGWMDAPGGRTLLQRSVRPMSVVMVGVLREGQLARLLARRG
jgi:hypothetical protein